MGAAAHIGDNDGDDALLMQWPSSVSKNRHSAVASTCKTQAWLADLQTAATPPLCRLCAGGHLEL
jgi:hypothetical protein